MTTTNFDVLNFDPNTKELSIQSGGQIIYGPFNLSTTAIKLLVSQDDSGQLQTAIETASIGTFPTENFELKIKFLGKQHHANLLFGKLSDNSVSPFSNNEILAVKNKFHALWIGADDIRNTCISTPKGLLPMEQKIISFEIVNEHLVLKYHSSITPN